jgi:hypothetical protein
MLPSLKRKLSQVEMRIRRSGDDDDVDPRILNELFGAAVGLDSWVVLLGVVLRFRCSLDDSVQLELRDVLDEGDVESFGAEAVADDADVEGFGGHGVGYGEGGVVRGNTERKREEKMERETI